MNGLFCIHIPDNLSLTVNESTFLYFVYGGVNYKQRQIFELCVLILTLCFYFVESSSSNMFKKIIGIC
ncbi:hypothetical protein CLOSBL3_11517 [Clostridiaceae bacterium BL-3]|nr:hypothetical protein CLOSBL3_11517 [Clostridiaceae bacterium BL-3]